MAAPPHVVVHVAVSVDGATTGFEPDLARYYSLASIWNEDVTLAGADTILAQEATLASAPRPGPVADGPLLAVVDGRRRVRQWDTLRECGHWSDAIGLHAPDGEERVDLRTALRDLAENGARVVRVDSGGQLTGALLRAGLVDELSLVVHPQLAGGEGHPWHGSEPVPAAALEVIAREPLDGGLAWL
jgi:2,5-diamino-6-(ribosylamino)-4(3H)-pyrimidinone 5'-phosphate reductase